MSLRKGCVAFASCSRAPAITVGCLHAETDLEFTLEESQLHVPSRIGSSAEVRDDLVYIPHLDEERDAKLLESRNMPNHFLEQIRFERSAATKFLTALQKALKK